MMFYDSCSFYYSVNFCQYKFYTFFKQMETYFFSNSIINKDLNLKLEFVGYNRKRIAIYDLRFMILIHV